MFISDVASLRPDRTGTDCEPFSAAPCEKFSPLKCYSSRLNFPFETAVEKEARSIPKRLMMASKVAASANFELGSDVYSPMIVTYFHKFIFISTYIRHINYDISSMANAHLFTSNSFPRIASRPRGQQPKKYYSINLKFRSFTL